MDVCRNGGSIVQLVTTTHKIGGHWRKSTHAGEFSNFFLKWSYSAKIVRLLQKVGNIFPIFSITCLAIKIFLYSSVLLRPCAKLKTRTYTLKPPLWWKSTTQNDLIHWKIMKIGSITKQITDLRKKKKLQQKLSTYPLEKALQAITAKKNPLIFFKKHIFCP